MLANTSVRFKLFLLLSLPVLAVLYMSSAKLMALYETSRSAHMLAELVELAEASGSLIHELQKERGLSAGFTASKGAVFASEVPAQRQLSRQSAGILRETLGIFMTMVPDSPVRSAYGAALSSLDRLGEVQGRIDSFSLAPTVVIAAYTDLIVALQKALNAALSQCDSAALYKEAVIMTDFIAAKEFAGQERATLNAALSATRFTPDVYRQWIRRVALQGELLQKFQEGASPSLRSLYAQRVPRLLETVEQFRKAALDSADKPVLEGAPKAWFSASTVYIDALHEVEVALSSALKQQASAMSVEARHQWYMTLAATALVLLGSALLAVWVVRDITVPLRATVYFAREISEGHWHALLELRRKDEIGQLATSLNGMVHALKAMVDKAEAASLQASDEADKARVATCMAEARQRAEREKQERMQSAAHRIGQVSTVLTTVAQDISTRITQATQSSRVQAQRMQSTATAMEQMSGAVTQVAGNSEHAALVSDKARVQAQYGSEVSRQAAQSIENVMLQVSALKSHMSDLNARVQDVDKVLSVISDIADQTNLLALNAAIEAARAGDAGRGFAVVADEVRKLAEKTMRATHEVGNVLSGIREDTTRNVCTVEDTVCSMEKTSELTRTSDTVLQQIVGLVEEATTQIRSIATATHQQSSTSEQVSHSVEEVHTLAAGTVGDMALVSDSIATLLGQSRQLEGLIVELEERQ